MLVSVCQTLRENSNTISIELAKTALDYNHRGEQVKAVTLLRAAIRFGKLSGIARSRTAWLMVELAKDYLVIHQEKKADRTFKKAVALYKTASDFE
ncbi:MAG: hypothetical protein ACRD3W_15250, partial [Terriglobales bacterium]